MFELPLKVDKVAVTAAIDGLNKRERSADLPSDTVQWLYWAAHPAFSSRFDDLLKVIEVCGTRALTSTERQTLIDGLAVGRTNFTPSRVDWAFRYAPPSVRKAIQSHVDLGNLQRTVEEAIVAATPFDPSSESYYKSLWVGFKGSLSKEKNAFKWSLK